MSHFPLGLDFFVPCFPHNFAFVSLSSIFCLLFLSFFRFDVSHRHRLFLRVEIWVAFQSCHCGWHVNNYPTMSHLFPGPRLFFHIFFPSFFRFNVAHRRPGGTPPSRPFPSGCRCEDAASCSPVDEGTKRSEVGVVAKVAEGCPLEDRNQSVRTATIPLFVERETIHAKINSHLIFLSHFLCVFITSLTR